MNWSYGYKVTYRLERTALPSDGWAILDDFFPNLLTGFRVAEYNAHLQRFSRLTIYSTLTDFPAQARAYAKLYPDLAPRVRPFSRACS